MFARGDDALEQTLTKKWILFLVETLQWLHQNPQERAVDDLVAFLLTEVLARA